MTQPTTTIPIASILLDEDIYPRKGIDPKRVGIFAENIRDGFKFDPVEVEPAPDKPGMYRLLDGAHRWSSCKSTGTTETEAIIKNPSLSSADIGKAIGRARRTVDLYIADLRAAIQMDIDIKIFHMNRLGIPQDRIARRLSIPQRTLSDHLAKMATLPNPLNTAT